MSFENIIKIGCLVTIVIVVIFIGSIIFIFVDTYDFSNSQAKGVVMNSDFQKIENYLKDHKEIKFITYTGDNQSNVEKTWQVNNLLIDYDNSLIYIIPDTLSYFDKQEIINNPYVKNINFENYIKSDTVAYTKLDIHSLNIILTKIKKFEFKYVTVDSIKINYRIRSNSPISQGFGILSYLENKNHRIENTEYAEYYKLDNKHFKYKEFVD